MFSYCGAGEDSWESLGQQGLILKEINSEYSLEALMLKLKLQNFGHLMGTGDSLKKKKKNLDAGEDWRQEEKGATEDKMDGWHHWLNGHEFQQTPGKSEGREACHTVVHAIAKNWAQLSDWATTNI